MIKKTIFLLICVIILSSCGRKGDPIYKEESENEVSLKVLINKV